MPKKRRLEQLELLPPVELSKYRYRLTRKWAGDPGPSERLLWIMLNPSTATETQDDPTIRRCIAFSKAWGFPGLDVVNVCAFRATDPAELSAAADPVGETNDYVIEFHAIRAPLIVVAWGDQVDRVPGREAQIVEILRRVAPAKTFALGLTEKRHPRHPLYIKGDTQRSVLPWLQTENNPPIPSVCKNTVTNCPCSGKCPGAAETSCVTSCAPGSDS